MHRERPVATGTLEFQCKPRRHSSQVIGGVQSKCHHSCANNCHMSLMCGGGVMVLWPVHTAHT